MPMYWDNVVCSGLEPVIDFDNERVTIEGQHEAGSTLNIHEKE